MYFNTSYVTVQLQPALFQTAQASFQYILCYGSTGWKGMEYAWNDYFNTSYVTVQR